MRSKNARMVAQFRHHFGLPVRSFPDVFAADLDLHGKLLAEEVSEFLIAVKEQDPVEVVDALGDILYVAYGCALDAGVDVDAAFARIHESNMAKLGPDGRPIKDEHGKVRKPDGWEPPWLADLAGIDPR